MSRERFIDQQFFRSKSVKKLSHSAQLTLVGLIVFADDHGRGRGSAYDVRLQLYPCGQETEEQVEGWLREIESFEIARFYPVDGTTYYDLPNFQGYQGLRYLSKSKIPPYPGNGISENSRKFRKVSANCCYSSDDVDVDDDVENSSSSQPKGSARTFSSSPAKEKGFSNPQKKEKKISQEDLRDNKILERLRQGAVRRGFIKGSEADRLKYFAAAEHALKEGKEGAGNLFVWIVTSGHWEVLTDADDDRARKRIKEMRDEPK